MKDLYEPLLERDLDAIPGAVQSFLESHSPEELWISIARFAVLAHASSQHSKRAVLAVRAAWDLREAMKERWPDLVVECARYAAESRQPWSEPPILEQPHVDPSEPADAGELRAAIAAGDRERAERWLVHRLQDADADLLAVARGDALLVTDAVLALAPLLGDRGRYALLRVAIVEMLAGNTDDDVADDLDALVAECVRTHGDVQAVRQVLLWNASRRPHGPTAAGRPLEPYRLARDYAQTLLAHATARTLPPQHVEPLLAAVHENLARGEGYEEWSLA